ncbi:MAG: hypothetical protein AAGE84_02405 [Cyanobacteria bacterium P01_G01_bin.39]
MLRILKVVRSLENYLQIAKCASLEKLRSLNSLPSRRAKENPTSVCN